MKNSSAFLIIAGGLGSLTMHSQPARAAQTWEAVQYDSGSNGYCSTEKVGEYISVSSTKSLRDPGTFHFFMGAVGSPTVVGSLSLVSVELDGTRFTALAGIKVKEGYFHISISKPRAGEFVSSFRNASDMKIFLDGAEIYRSDVSGASASIGGLLDCSDRAQNDEGASALSGFDWFARKFEADVGPWRVSGHRYTDEEFRRLLAVQVEVARSLAEIGHPVEVNRSPVTCEMDTVLDGGVQMKWSQKQDGSALRVRLEMNAWPSVGSHDRTARLHVGAKSYELGTPVLYSANDRLAILLLDTIESHGAIFEAIKSLRGSGTLTLGGRSIGKIESERLTEAIGTLNICFSRMEAD